MASTVSAVYASQLTVTETFTDGYVSSGDNTITVNGLNESGTLTASSSVPATKQAVGTTTMTSGSASIDLTALASTALPSGTAGTVTFNGLKLQILKLRNLSTNANVIKVAKGASNGYGLDSGGADWDVTLSPGQSVVFLLKDTAPDVGSSAKTFDLTGTGSQVLEWHMVAG